MPTHSGRGQSRGGERGLVCLGGFVSFGLATLLDFHWEMVRDKA